MLPFLENQMWITDGVRRKWLWLLRCGKKRCVFLLVVSHTQTYIYIYYIDYVSTYMFYNILSYTHTLGGERGCIILWLSHLYHNAQGSIKSRRFSPGPACHGQGGGATAPSGWGRWVPLVMDPLFLTLKRRWKSKINDNQWLIESQLLMVQRNIVESRMNLR